MLYFKRRKVFEVLVMFNWFSGFFVCFKKKFVLILL